MCGKTSSASKNITSVSIKLKRANICAYKFQTKKIIYLPDRSADASTSNEQVPIESTELSIIASLISSLVGHLGNVCCKVVLLSFAKSGHFGEDDICELLFEWFSTEFVMLIVGTLDTKIYFRMWLNKVLVFY